MIWQSGWASPRSEWVDCGSCEVPSAPQGPGTQRQQPAAGEWACSACLCQVPLASALSFLIFISFYFSQTSPSVVAMGTFVELEKHSNETPQQTSAGSAHTVGRWRLPGSTGGSRALMARLHPQLWRRVTTTGGGATTLGFLCLRWARPRDAALCTPASRSEKARFGGHTCAPCLWPLGFLLGFVAKRDFKRKLSLSVLDGHTPVRVVSHLAGISSSPLMSQMTSGSRE